MLDQLNKIYNFLVEKGYTVSEDKENSVIKVKYPNSEETYNISIDFSNEFPFNFPRVYIDEEFKKRSNMLAHVFSGDLLCLKFDGKEMINPTKPLEIVEYILEKTKIVIDKAISGNLNNERFEELSEYWTLINDQKSKIEIMTFYDPSVADRQTIDFGNYVIPKESNKILIFQRKDNFCGKDYLELFCKADSISIKSNQCIFVYVETADEAYQLRRFDKLIDYLYNIKDSQIDSYFKTHKKKGLITLVVKELNYKQYSVFYLFKEYSNKVLRKNVQKILPLNSNDYVYFNVIPTDFNQASLFDRSSSGEIDSRINKVCIVGCGAIGSHVAEYCASIGSTHITLVDNDVFKESNLLRHVCSVDEIGVPKSQAVKCSLLKNYPYLEINEITDSIFNCDFTKLGEDNYDLIIVATGEMASEYYCCNEFFARSMSNKVILLWLEPYAVSGHALVYNKSSWKEDDFDSLYSNINQISSVLNKEEFFKKEAGCSSAYIPYSGLDLTIFVAEFMKKFLVLDRGSYSYSKMINIVKYKRDNSMKLNCIYYSKTDGDVIIGDIYD